MEGRVLNKSNEFSGSFDLHPTNSTAPEIQLQILAIVIADNF